jgi:hypothetical protein
MYTGMEITENPNSVCFLQTENGNGKLLKARTSKFTVVDTSTAVPVFQWERFRVLFMRL